MVYVANKLRALCYISVLNIPAVLIEYQHNDLPCCRKDKDLLQNRECNGKHFDHESIFEKVKNMGIFLSFLNTEVAWVI